MLLGLPAVADPPRWTPDHCLDYVAGTDTDAEADRLWNRSYRQGFRAIERADYHAAEAEMCRALIVAREFGPRDWRFAETLDELGLIAFQLRDFDLAERMQGAAVAEMLLAVGPHGEPVQGLDSSKEAVVRQDCNSGIRVYVERLGWIHEKMKGRTSTDELRHAPWTVFAAGYVALDSDLAQRLEWLISQYLLQENLDAAEALTGLQRAIAGD